jgi:hypothetical protein
MDQGETGQWGCSFFQQPLVRGIQTMARRKKSPSKTVRKEVRSGQGRVNKAAQIREFLRINPTLTFAQMTSKFEALGLTVTSAQFYSLRNEMKSGGSNKSPRRKTKTQAKQRRKKITPARAPVVTAKQGCTMEPQTAAEIYGDPSLSLEASTQPPNVERVLQARNILERAYLEAWQIVGQNYDLVDIIVDDIQEKHKAH